MVGWNRAEPVGRPSHVGPERKPAWAGLQLTVTTYM